MTDHPAPISQRESAATPTDTENAPQATLRGAQAQEATPDDLAAIDADYQTHCVECFMGMPEHCTEGLAPNGQPCVTTPAQRIAWLLDVVQRVVAQRNAADTEVAALTARLAAVEAERDAAVAAVRDVLWILHHGEIAGMESNAWVHGMRYSDAFIAEATKRREAAEALVRWEPTDGG